MATANAPENHNWPKGNDMDWTPCIKVPNMGEKRKRQMIVKLQSPKTERNLNSGLGAVQNSRTIC